MNVPVDDDEYILYHRVQKFSGEIFDKFDDLHHNYFVKISSLAFSIIIHSIEKYMVIQFTKILSHRIMQLLNNTLWHYTLVLYIHSFINYISLHGTDLDVYS